MFSRPHGVGIIKPAATLVDPAHVQSVSGGRATSAAALQAAWGTTTIAGNTLFAHLSAVTPGAGSLADTPVPPAGEGWTLYETAISNLGTGGGRRALWSYYNANASAQSGTKTWSYTNGVYMGGASGVIVMQEYSGIKTSSPLDTHANYNSPSNGGGFPWTDDTTAYSGTPGTTSQANTIAIGVITSNQSLSAMSGGFTERISVTTPHYVKVGELILHATGTPNTSGTYASAGANVGTLGCFKFGP